MVSAEHYLKTFFRVMPRRFKIMRDQRSEKRKIDALILQGQQLPDKPINSLIDIIGRDALFRKAEKRNKPTLRHIISNVAHSFEKFDDLSQVLPERVGEKSIVRNAIEIQTEIFGVDIFRNESMRVKNLIAFVDSITPQMKDLLMELDKIYIQEVRELEAYLNGEKSIGAYKSLLEKEDEIIRQAASLFSSIGQKSAELLNLLKEFVKAFKSNPKIRELRVIGIKLLKIVLVINVVAFIWGVFTSSDPLGFARFSASLAPYVLYIVGVAGLANLTIFIKKAVNEMI